MARFILSPAAERDLESILAWTHEHFGEQARIRYEALIVQAIVDVADDPTRVGSMTRDEVLVDVRTYHLWHSRNNVEKTHGRVRRPRHILIYRSTSPNQVEIGRVLHESMDLASHLPAEFGAFSDKDEGEQ